MAHQLRQRLVEYPLRSNWTWYVSSKFIADVRRNWAAAEQTFDGQGMANPIPESQQTINAGEMWVIEVDGLGGGHRIRNQKTLVVQ
ncbi:hypothetical protein TWF718_006269 [Orbilia javanica]|uniref:Uncharacterized protein n=1 Tax=Orbilia javanica TaxID=47235 RepID=A0AAN8REU7_9PEZI